MESPVIKLILLPILYYLIWVLLSIVKKRRALPLHDEKMEEELEVGRKKSSYIVGGRALTHEEAAERTKNNAIAMTKERLAREKIVDEENKKINELDSQMNLLGVSEEYLSRLQPEEAQVLQRLSAWPLDERLKEHLVAQSAFQDRVDVWKYYVMYKRFMFFKGRLSSTGYDPENLCAMYSRRIDMIWHQHILHTREYEKFCESVFGHFVHHLPHIYMNIFDTRSDMKAWLNEYKRAFGDLPGDFEDGFFEIRCG